MPKFNPKKIAGVSYTMAHLEDGLLQVPKGSNVYRVLVTYSCHCFTEELKPHHTPDLHYNHKHEKRAFCLTRHAQSVALPGFISDLPGKSVYLAQKGNFFLVRSNGCNYVVFLTVRRATNPRYDVVLIVQSAHDRTPFISYAQPLRFEDLVEAVATNAPWTAGPKQKIKRS